MSTAPEPVNDQNHVFAERLLVDHKLLWQLVGLANPAELFKAIEEAGFKLDPRYAVTVQHGMEKIRAHIIDQVHVLQLKAIQAETKPRVNSTNNNSAAANW